MILILQAIEKDLRKNISEFSNSEIFVRIDQNNKIVGGYGNKNEYENFSISDQRGNYFYIRDKDSGETKITPYDGVKITSRSNIILIENQYLFVCVLKNIDEEKIKEILINTITYCGLKKEIQCLYSNLKVEVIEVVTDSNKVLLNEGIELRQRDINLFFISASITISYTKDLGLQKLCDIC